ncbi:alpha-amylase [Nakamurella silvestris]|nr:alpha-amylase [Nakamurella silvestris]
MPTASQPAAPVAPEAALRAAAKPLSGLKHHQQETFELRLHRWWPDLSEGLRAVYPTEVADTLALRLVKLAAKAFADRDPELARLDARRTLEPDWFQHPRMLGYATYADRFAGDLTGVRKKIDYLKELGVTYLHLMPVLQPREGDNDGGYAIADYRSIRTDLGTFKDLRKLSSALRKEGISLVLDLVLNHVAAEHTWAEQARAGDANKRQYFYLYPDRAIPDAYERTLPEVFPDFAPGNFTWDEDLQSWVWTTFNSWQWDVNWTNPEVFAEYADLVLFLANAGVEVLRLDAIAFLWKRLGTNSQNQPEVHAITQALKAIVRIACPATIFKAEAIVGPADLVHYFGTGVHHAKVSDLAYHNTLMVQLWSMLAAGDVTLAAQALRALPPTPTTTAWITYLRCHDDIGWAIDDLDAAAVGLDGFEHRRFLSDYFSGAFSGSPADGLVFQANPDTGDRRISGTTAGLIGLQKARQDYDPEAVQQALQKELLAHALVFGWGGIPVVWMGDELGLPNDPAWAEEPGHASDNRWTHRPAMPWARAALREDPDTVEGWLFRAIADLAATRAGLPHLHASVPAQILPVHDNGVLPVLRRHPVGDLLGLYNVTGEWRPYPLSVLDGLGLGDPVDAITGDTPNRGEDGNLWLPPYAAHWLVAGS